jgi:hypothetical protein
MRTPHLERTPWYWRERAEEMRTIADNMRTADAKDTFWVLAENYDQMARDAERRLVHGQ